MIFYRSKRLVFSLVKDVARFIVDSFCQYVTIGVDERRQPVVIKAQHVCLVLALFNSICFSAQRTRTMRKFDAISHPEILLAKSNYRAEESRELTIEKNERLILLDDSGLWWKVKRIDSNECGFIPSNFARREKRSLLSKLIFSKRIGKKSLSNSSIDVERILSIGLVKFRYEAKSKDEISLNKDVWVKILEKKNDGWWFVQFEERRGWFPSNYLIEKTSDDFSSIEPNHSEEFVLPSIVVENSSYFGSLSRDEAEKLLKMSTNQSGDFLIRDSERRFGQLSLSIRDDDEIIRHFRIEYSNVEKRFFIGKRSFSNLDELIEHYRRHPVFDGDSNEKLFLRNVCQMS